ncbi:MAG: hypothetical protein ACLFTP_09690 [Rhodosalinus sp.]
MPDHMTAEERAAVEAAVAEGRVTKAPPGQSGLTTYRWSEHERRLVTVQQGPDGCWRRGNQQYAVAGRNGAKGRVYTADPRVEARRKEVAALAAEGLSGAQIADRLGVGVSVVYADCRAAGVRLSRRRPAAPAPEAAEEEAADEEAADGEEVPAAPAPAEEPPPMPILPPDGTPPGRTAAALMVRPQPTGGGLPAEVETWLLSLCPCRLLALRGEVLARLEGEG